MQRLGRNKGRYLGETLEIAEVLSDIEQAARKSGWMTEPMAVSERLRLVTLRRLPEHACAGVYISAGIHGDEPAGPVAVRQMMLENTWPADVAIWLCACLNPEGFRLNTRENELGLDLNRDYRQFQSEVVRAHVRWLEQLPRFDLTLLLHEDWEANGFYLYELNPDNQPSFSPPIIDAVKAVCPIDTSAEIEGRAAEGGLIRADPDPESRAQWPEAFYLVQKKTRLSYTLEAPSDFPLPARVQALVAGTRAALGELAARTSARRVTQTPSR